MKKRKNKKVISILNFAIYLIIDLTFLISFIALALYASKNPEYLKGNMNTWEVIGTIASLIMISEFISNTYDACFNMIKIIKKEKKQCKQK